MAATIALDYVFEQIYSSLVLLNLSLESYTAEQVFDDTAKSEAHDDRRLLVS